MSFSKDEQAIEAAHQKAIAAFEQAIAELVQPDPAQAARLQQLAQRLVALGVEQVAALQAIRKAVTEGLE